MLLTVSEVAEREGVSADTVRRRVRDRELTAMLVAGRYLIDETELTAGGVNPPDQLTVTQAATDLRCSTAKVRGYINAGQLKATRKNTPRAHYRINQSDLDAFKASTTLPATT